MSSSIGNFAHPDFPELDDDGDAYVITDNGVTGFVRVDWFTSEGLRTWGDRRSIILGPEGCIELRKYTSIATDERPGHVFLVDGLGEKWFNATGRVGYPFFGELVLDCLGLTENAMTQEHALKAAELSVRAKRSARGAQRRRGAGAMSARSVPPKTASCFQAKMIVACWQRRSAGERTRSSLMNIKNVRQSILESLGLEANTADGFLLDQFDLEPEATI